MRAARLCGCECTQRHQGSPLLHSSFKGRGNSWFVRIEAFLVLQLVMGTLMCFSHGSGCSFPFYPSPSSILCSNWPFFWELPAQTGLILHLEINNLSPSAIMLCVPVIFLTFFPFSSSKLRLGMCRGAWLFCPGSEKVFRGGKKVFIMCQSEDACEQARKSNWPLRQKMNLKKKVYFNDSEKEI